MTNNKSDFRRFCETMWIMVKHGVLPWVLVAGFFAAVVISLKDAESKGALPQQKTNVHSFFQKQR